jgi:hypothetical protein
VLIAGAEHYEATSERFPGGSGASRPEALHPVEMDAYLVPEEQAAVLGNHHARAERRVKHRAQQRLVIDLDDPIATLALRRLRGALELDEMRRRDAPRGRLEISRGSR